ncbi:MAG: hypothetical protein GY804_06050 [Alphaproteobacteria bacterium]|nr:hypothetical protein [Alphaproteobacteria bacterium]
MLKTEELSNNGKKRRSFVKGAMAATAFFLGGFGNVSKAFAHNNPSSNLSSESKAFSDDLILLAMENIVKFKAENPGEEALKKGVSVMSLVKNPETGKDDLIFCRGLLDEGVINVETLIGEKGDGFDFEFNVTNAIFEPNYENGSFKYAKESVKIENPPGIAIVGITNEKECLSCSVSLLSGFDCTDGKAEEALQLAEKAKEEATNAKENAEDKVGKKIAKQKLDEAKKGVDEAEDAKEIAEKIATVQFKSIVSDLRKGGELLEETQAEIKEGTSLSAVVKGGNVTKVECELNDDKAGIEAKQALALQVEQGLKVLIGNENLKPALPEKSYIGDNSILGFNPESMMASLKLSTEGTVGSVLQASTSGVVHTNKQVAPEPAVLNRRKFLVSALKKGRGE